MRGFEGGSEGEDLRAVADRAHAAAAELDAILGGEAATTYTYKALAGLGSAPDLAAVTELADKLESRLRQAGR